MHAHHLYMRIVNNDKSFILKQFKRVKCIFLYNSIIEKRSHNIQQKHTRSLVRDIHCTYLLISYRLWDSNLLNNLVFNL